MLGRQAHLPLLAVGWLALAACGEPAQTNPPPKAPPPPPVSSVEPYFPLEDGRIYHYVTQSGRETGMIVAKVHRTDTTHGELQLSNATQHYEYTPDGVLYEGRAYILKAPLEVGKSWPGQHGGTTSVSAVDLLVEVPAGKYSACVRTTEEDAQGGRSIATYCPGVGMVTLEVSGPNSEPVKAELKSYGKPVKIE